LVRLGNKWEGKSVMQNGGDIDVGNAEEDLILPPSCSGKNFDFPSGNSAESKISVQTSSITCKASLSPEFRKDAGETRVNMEIANRKFGPNAGSEKKKLQALLPPLKQSSSAQTDVLVKFMQEQQRQTLAQQEAAVNAAAQAAAAAVAAGFKDVIRETLRSEHERLRDSLERSQSGHFEEMRSSMAELGVKIDVVGDSLQVIETKMDKQTGKLQEIGRKVENIVGTLDRVESKLDAVDTKVSWLQKLQMRMGIALWTAIVIVGIIAICL